LPSSHEEIMAVYQDDIDRLSYIVEHKYGKQPFYDGFAGMSVRKIHDYDPTKVKNTGEK
jgi:hypothetical protein